MDDKQLANDVERAWSLSVATTEMLRRIMGRLTGSTSNALASDSSVPRGPYARLLDGQGWPTLTPHDSICGSGDLQCLRDRAAAVATLWASHVTDRRVLDFGCGDGLLVQALVDRGVDAAGYDPNLPAALESARVTRDFDTAMARGPFDVVLLYDVIDHVTGETPAQMLMQAASALTPQGRLVVRGHPWCGRHGGHLYHQLDRAFAHLFFPEMVAEVPDSPTLRVTQPEVEYRAIFDEANLTVESELVRRDVVDPFFSRMDVAKHLATVLDDRERPPIGQLSQTYLDWVLCPRRD